MRRIGIAPKLPLGWGLMLIITLVILGVCSFATVNAIRADRATPTQSPHQSTSQIRWNTYPVGGLILVNPAIKDSLGNFQMIELPPGSMLGVPYLIEGEVGSRMGRDES